MLTWSSRSREGYVKYPSNLDWKRSARWLESWEGLLFVTDVLTTCAEAIFRVLVSRKFKNPSERFDWSINRVAVGKCVMWLTVETCAERGYANRWVLRTPITQMILWCVEKKQTLVEQHVLNSTVFIDGCTSYKTESISYHDKGATHLLAKPCHIYLL